LETYPTLEEKLDDHDQNEYMVPDMVPGVVTRAAHKTEMNFLTRRMAVHLKEWGRNPSPESIGQLLDRIRQNGTELDRNWTETGQIVTIPIGNRTNSQECKGALFSQFSSFVHLLFNESDYTRSGIGMREK